MQFNLLMNTWNTVLSTQLLFLAWASVTSVFLLEGREWWELFLPPKNPSHSIGCWRKVTGYMLSPNFVLYQITKSKVTNRKTIPSGWLEGTWHGVQDDYGGLWPEVITPILAEREPLWQTPKSCLKKADGEQKFLGHKDKPSQLHFPREQWQFSRS